MKDFYLNLFFSFLKYLTLLNIYFKLSQINEVIFNNMQTSINRWTLIFKDSEFENEFQKGTWKGRIISTKQTLIICFLSLLNLFGSFLHEIIISDFGAGKRILFIVLILIVCFVFELLLRRFKRGIQMRGCLILFAITYTMGDTIIRKTSLEKDISFTSR